MTKISLQPQNKALIEANLESKLEMIVLTSLLRFITACRFQDDGVVIDWDSKVTHISRSKFISRLKSRYSWIHKYEIVLVQILKGYTQMISDDFAKVGNVSLIVLRLRDLIETRIWQPDYLEYTAEYLMSHWKVPKQKGLSKKGQLRRPRKDPKTESIREQLSRRKYRLKLRNK